MKKIFLLVVFFVILSINFSSASWFDSSCGYKRAINLSFTSGSQSDYESYVNLTQFPNTNGTTASDYVFTNSQENAELSAEIVNQSIGNWYYFVVRINDTIDNLNNTDAYVYYGSSCSPLKRNNHSAFHFWDGFDSANTTKWNATHGVLNVTNGTAELISRTIDGDTLTGNEAFGYGFAHEAIIKANISSWSPSDEGGIVLMTNRHNAIEPGTNSSSLRGTGQNNPNADPLRICDFNQSANSCVGWSPEERFSLNPNLYTYVFYNSSLTLSYNNSINKINNSNNIPNSSYYPGLRVWGGSGGASVMNVDSYWVRRWNEADINPTFSIGDEIVPILDLIINQPVGVFTSRLNINYDVSSLNNTNLNVCRYWISTQGGGVEISNTTITCNETMIGNFNVSVDGILTFNIFVNNSIGNNKTLSINFTVDTSIITPSAGGGGGGSSQQSKPLNWTITTETGSERYELLMVSGSSRDKIISLKNFGTENVSISLRCENINGTLCKYINITNKELILSPVKGLSTFTDMEINLPKDVKNQIYISNIIARDNAGNERSISVLVDVGTFGFFSELFVKLSSSTKLYNVNIPYLILFLGFVSIFIFLSYFIVNSTILNGKYLWINIFLGFIIGSVIIVII